MAKKKKRKVSLLLILLVLVLLLMGSWKLGLLPGNLGIISSQPSESTPSAFTLRVQEETIFLEDKAISLEELRQVLEKEKSPSITLVEKQAIKASFEAVEKLLQDLKIPYQTLHEQ